MATKKSYHQPNDLVDIARCSSAVYADEKAFVRRWVESLVNPVVMSGIKLTAIKNGWGKMQESRSYSKGHLCLGGRPYETGLAVYADSEVQFISPVAVRRFCALVGIDENSFTLAGQSQKKVIFSLKTGGREQWRSQPMSVGMTPLAVDVPLSGQTEFTLKAISEDGDKYLAHADWVDARVELADGRWLFLAHTLEELRFPSALPFSFQYGTRTGSDIFALDAAIRSSGTWCDGRRNHTLAWHDVTTGLMCLMELTEFEDFPAIEWVLHFRNDGPTETPILKDVRSLDVVWPGKGPAAPVLYRSRGSKAQVDDFSYLSEEMGDGLQRTIRVTAGREGRPSVDWLPFFNLQTGDDGIMVGLGWNGQWFAEFDHDGFNNIQIRAGMETLNLRLHAGESIRSPRILLLYWKGESIHGHNMLRKFLLAHHTPRHDGQPVEAPICNGSWGGTPTSEHLELIHRIHTQQLPYDYYWVDAGWYGDSAIPCPNVFTGDWAREVGDWRVNKNYHPDGLRVIRDAAHEAGMKFLLWFDTKRAKQGTPVTLEHPEWFLTQSEKLPMPLEDLLLNLGCPEAFRWAMETVSRLITENGIDCYREDFLFAPLEAFRNHDTPDRQGMTEIRYVEGAYAFWDELRRRHPQLLIDNCASGGRRIELETLGRSLTLWRSDYNCSPDLKAEGSQVQSFGLAHWIPISATSPCAKPGDTYQFRSALSAGIIFSLDEFALHKNTEASDYPWVWHRKMMADHRRARPCYYGDFYPLTNGSLFPDTWLAYQLHRPDLNEGMVLAFRRGTSPFTDAVFKLRGLQSRKQYTLEDTDTGRLMRLDAETLARQGVSLHIEKPRDSRLLFYKNV